MNTRYARHSQDKVLDAEHVTVLDDYSLGVYEAIVHCDSTAGIFSLTLPSVANAAGHTYSIILTVDGGNVTVQDRSDSYGWSDITLADAADRVVLMSDGECWWTLASVGV